MLQLVYVLRREDSYVLRGAWYILRFVVKGGVKECGIGMWRRVVCKSSAKVGGSIMWIEMEE